MRPLFITIIVLAWLALFFTSPFPDPRYPTPVDSSTYVTRP